jgi:glucose/arabinose dehydrogenase
MYTPRAGRIGLAMIATGAAIFGAAPQVVSSAPGHAASRQARSQVELVVSGLEGASGSAVGPGGDLYVTEGAAGRIVRIDRRTGHRTVFASGCADGAGAVA